LEGVIADLVFGESSLKMLADAEVSEGCGNGFAPFNTR